METANTSNNDARELRALRLSGTLDMDARNPDVVIPLSNEPEAKEGGFELAPPEQTVRAAVHREKDGDAASLAPSDFAKVAGPARSCFSFRPQLNQFFANGIYRSIGGAERKVTWEELFQDLLFVYLVRLVGEASVNSEAFGGENASRAIGSFVLLFYPVWISWFLTQLHVNQFYHETSAIYYRLAFLFQSAVVAGLGSVIPTVLSTHDEIKGLGNPGKAFVTFICLGRAELILQTLVHAVALPRFAPSLLLRALALVIPMLFYVAWLASGFTHLQELWWTAVATDLVLVFVVIPIATDGMAFRPATNLGHWAERMGLFTLIVLGEEVSNVVFEQPPTFSFSILGFSLLGLHLIRTQSKLYDASSRGVTTHAIRRSWLWESQWNVVHFPLHGSIVG